MTKGEIVGCAFYGDKYHCNERCACHDGCEVRIERGTYEYLMSEKFGVLE
jgi:hypothetical protein